MGIFNDNSQNDHYGHIKVACKDGIDGKDGTGFKLTDKGNYDIDGKRLTDVADSIGDNDAVNLKVLKEHTQVSQNNYHLQPSFKIFKDFGDKSQLTVGSPPNTSPDHFFQNHKAHNDAYIIEKEGYDNGFGGQAWSSIKIKGNQLESGSYTSIFEIFVIGNANGFRVDDTIIYHVYGDSHYTINTFDSDKIDSQYTKSIIQFTTDGGAGVDDGIKFQIRYYGSQYNKNLKFLFYSRVIKGKQSTSFNHNIFNVSDVDDNHEILYFENLNMNSNLINGLGDPVDDADAANKKFVDTEIAKVHIDTTPLLPRNGSRSMFGDLDMDGNHILSVENLVDYKDVDPYEYRVKDLKSVVNKEYLNENFLKKVDKDGIEYYDLKQIVIKNSAPHDDGSYDNNTLVSKAFIDAEISKLPKPDTDVLKLDGSKAMTGNLDMGGNIIKNIKHFIEDDSSQAASDAQRNQVINFGYFKDERGELKRLINKVSSDNVKYVNDTIENKIKDSEERSIQSVQQENIFKKVMTDNLFKEDDRIEFLSTINYNLLHRINHQTYLFRIKKDPPDSYNCRLSIDLRYLPTGTYTMVFEMKFFPQIDHDKVSVNAVSSSLNQVSTNTRVIKFDYGYYSRSIINFNKSFTNPSIDDLDIYLSLKDTASQKPDKTSINVIVYGVKGTHSDIPIQTWDKLYDINNSILEFEIPINMNKKAITNLKDPVNDQDAATKQYVDNNNKIIHQENAFLKVMDESLFILDDDDIHQIGVVNKDFYEHNKKTYHFQIDYDSSIGYYSTRLGINVVYLPISHYTIVFEMYFSDKINKDEITIGAASGTLQVNNTNTIVSTNNTRSIINFNKLQIEPSDDELEIDIALKNKTSESYDPKTDIYVIVYGVYGTQNDIDKRLWDRYLYIDNNKINFEAPVNMGNRKITGVADATDDNDVVNKSQLDVFNYYFTSCSFLRHHNRTNVEFPQSPLWSPSMSFPFGLATNNNIVNLRIKLNGWYQIIYSDFVKNGGFLYINDDTNNVKLYEYTLNYNPNFIQFTVNCIIKIVINKNQANFIDIGITVSDLIPNTYSSSLIGGKMSNFYIKYLRPI